MEKEQRTQNFWWSIPGKKCGRNIARTRPPNSRGIVPPVLSAGQGGHFTPGRRGGSNRLVLRVRIHREGVQEPHGLYHIIIYTIILVPYFAYETFPWSSKTASISSPSPVLVIS
jgi:hypothetical protein